VVWNPLLSPALLVTAALALGARKPVFVIGGVVCTVSVVFPETAPEVAEIAVVPVLVPAVANPALLMVATAVFEDAQVT
jgi:hypothetical protein